MRQSIVEFSLVCLPNSVALVLIQVNVPRCLPFSGVGKVKQAACGGTGCAVLNGETLLREVRREAVGGLGGGDGSGSTGVAAAGLTPREGRERGRGKVWLDRAQFHRQ